MLSGIIGTAGSAVNTSGSNLALDTDAVFHASAANNIAIGANSLNSISGDADYNIAIGVDAGTNISTGNDNVLVGWESGLTLTTGVGNSAFGRRAFKYAELGESYNTAIGMEAMENCAEGTTGTIDGNVAVGFRALRGGDIYDASQAESVTHNVAIGAYCLQATSTEGSIGNIAIGYLAGSDIVQADDSADNANFTGIGYKVAQLFTTSRNNTMLGYNVAYNTKTGTSATDSDNNTLIGYSTGSGVWGTTFTQGSCSYNNGTTVTHGSNANIVRGMPVKGNPSVSPNGIPTGAYVKAIIDSTSFTLSTDTTDGSFSSQTLTFGDAGSSRNTAIGASTMQGVQKRCQDNVVVGYLAGNDMTTAFQSVLIGSGAGAELATSSNTTAIGYQAMDNTNGFDGNDNIYIGANAGDGNWATAESSQNTIIGSVGCRGNQNGALKNAGIGYAVLNTLTEGNYNTAMGANSGDDITTGSENTVLGYDAGDTIATGSWNICIGSLSDIEATGGNGQIAIGRTAIAQNDYETRIGYAGAFQFYSGLQNIDLSDAGDATATHTNPLFEIPAGAVIKSVSAVVTTLSSRTTSVLAIYMSDDTSRTDGATLTNGVELLGAGEATTTSYASSSASDIVASSSGGVLNASWYSEPKLNGLSAAKRYVYICNAGTGNGASNAGTDPKIRVCIEFAGQD